MQTCALRFKPAGSHCQRQPWFRTKLNLQTIRWKTQSYQTCSAHIVTNWHASQVHIKHHCDCHQDVKPSTTPLNLNSLSKQAPTSGDAQVSYPCSFFYQAKVTPRKTSTNGVSLQQVQLVPTEEKAPVLLCLFKTKTVKYALKLRRLNLASTQNCRLVDSTGQRRLDFKRII